MVLESKNLNLSKNKTQIIPFSQKLKQQTSWRVSRVLDEKTLSRLQSRVWKKSSFKTYLPDIEQEKPIQGVLSIENNLELQQSNSTFKKPIEVLEANISILETPKIIDKPQNIEQKSNPIDSNIQDEILDYLFENDYEWFIINIIQNYYNFPQLSAYHWDLFAKNWNKISKNQLPTHVSTLKTKLWVEDIHELFQTQLEKKLWMISFDEILNLYKNWVITSNDINSKKYNKFILKWNRENIEYFWMQFPQKYSDFLKLLWLNQETLSKAWLEELFSNLLQWKN